MRIGDRLYKYQGFTTIAEYVVTAVVKREKLTLYEAECQNCNHGFKCKILVRKVYGKECYQYVGSMNDEEEQYCGWHVTGKEHEMYYPIKREAKIKIYKYYIKSKKDEIEKHKGIIERMDKELCDLEGHLKNIIEEIK